MARRPAPSEAQLRRLVVDVAKAAASAPGQPLSATARTYAKLSATDKSTLLALTSVYRVPSLRSESPRSESTSPGSESSCVFEIDEPDGWSGCVWELWTVSSGASCGLPFIKDSYWKFQSTNAPGVQIDTGHHGGPFTAQGGSACFFGFYTNVSIPAAVPAGNYTYTLEFYNPSVHTPDCAGPWCPWQDSFTVENLTPPPSPSPSPKVTIDSMYIVQSVQTYHESVPLVQGKNGYVRVFLLADHGGARAPAVRVNLYVNGIREKSIDIPAPTGLAFVPTVTDEGSAGRSWNAPVPGALIVPGLSMSAEVTKPTPPDPVVFPTQVPVVDRVPALGVTFVPLSNDGAYPGNLNAVSTAYTKQIYPFSTINDQRADVLQIDAPGFPNDETAEQTVLSALRALRFSDGSSNTYFGVFHGDGNTQVLGGAWVGSPEAFGWDGSQANGIAAHELGHTFGRDHAPCGDPLPDGIDPHWPSDASHSGGQIGVYGFDVKSGQVKSKKLHDIMGYCNYEWISDYTYEGVLSRFAQRASGASAPAAAMRARAAGGNSTSEVLHFGGWVSTDGSLHVASAPFVIPLRKATPDVGTGDVVGLTRGGRTLFNRHFMLGPGGGDFPKTAATFEVAIPLTRKIEHRLVALRIETPNGSTTLRATRHGRPRARFHFDRDGNLWTQWDRRAFPAAWFIVCDPEQRSIFWNSGRLNLGKVTCSTITVRFSDRVLSFERKYRIEGTHVIPMNPLRRLRGRRI